MWLNRTLSRQIVDKAHSVLKRDILLCNPGGQLIATSYTSPALFVPEALAVAQSGQPFVAQFNGNKTQWWPFTYEGQTLAVFGLPLTAGNITADGMALVQGLAEVLVYQHFLLDRMQTAERLRANFIVQALTDTTATDTELYRQADILQLNLQSPQAIILIRLAGFEESVTQQHDHLASEEQQLRLDQAAAEIGAKLQAALQDLTSPVAHIGDDQFVVLKQLTVPQPNTINTIKHMEAASQTVHKTLAKLQPKSTVSVGIGQYYPDIRGLRKSYQDAQLALKVGSKIWGEGRVFHIQRVGMFTTLAAISAERRAELAHQMLAALVADPQLFKTVQVFLASGLNLSEASEQLRIHRNTLIYRLDKTKSLIGFDPRHFDDALQIKLALMFYAEQ
jgi:carbohydrate diacid regulator